MTLPSALRALRHRNFRTFFAGQALSVIGSWIQSITITWLAYKLSGSTAITGLVGFMTHIPLLLVSPFAGVLGDRLDQRLVLLAVQSLLIVLAITLTVLTYTHLITIPLLVLLALVLGLLNCVETPMRQSFFIRLIDDRNDLPNAIALNSVLMNGARLIGPALGGLLIAAANEAVSFLLNAMLTVAVLISLAKLDLKQRTSRALLPTSFLDELLEGWRYAFRSPPVRTLLALPVVLGFFFSPYATLMPAMVVATFDGGAELVGYFVSAIGFGALLGALRLAARNQVRGLTKWIAAAFVIAGAGIVGFSFSRIAWLSSLCLVFGGFGFITAAASIHTIMQSIVDDDKRARVASLYTAALIGSAPLGHLASGWLAERIGAPHTFLVNGSVSILAGLLFTWRLRHFRDLLRPIYQKRGIIPPPQGRPDE